MFMEAQDHDCQEQHGPRPDEISDWIGGRVLAWLGGAATLLGIVFFLVIAVSRGGWASMHEWCSAAPHRPRSLPEECGSTAVAAGPRPQSLWWEPESRACLPPSSWQVRSTASSLRCSR